MSSAHVLRAVVFVDLFEYSKFVSRYESDTLSYMNRCFALGRTEVEARGGELVKTTGDGFVSIFHSASYAIEFGMTFLRLAHDEKSGLPEQPKFRVGVHLGEIRREGNEIYGHPVNVTARLEAIAEPGTVLVSQEAYQAARRRIDFGFKANGVPVLKNIPERIPTYVVVDKSDESPVGSSDTILISVVGGVSASGPTGDLKIPRSVQLYGLLGYLALIRHHQETIDKLAALLWPQKRPADARRSLTQTFASFRRSISTHSPNAVGRNEDRLWLNEQLVTVDLDAMLANIELGEIDDVLLHGLDWDSDILAGLEQINPLLRAWIKVERKHWRQKFVTALENCLERFDPPEAATKSAAIALTNIEPGHEPASCRLIEHHIAVGNRANAVREYQRLNSYLKDQFDISPGREIQSILEQISEPPISVPEAPAAVLPRSKPVRRLQIVVGNFDLHGTVDDHRIYGFRSELITNLSRFREWSVLEASNQSPEASGEKQAGCYHLTGRYALADDQDRLHLQLSEAGSGRIIWSESLSLAMDSWTLAQRKSIGQIAGKMETYLSSDRLSGAVNEVEGSTKIFDRWLQSEYLLSQWHPETDDKAEEILQDIIAEEPSFAPAYGSLTSVYNVRHIVRPGLELNDTISKESLELGQTGVDLDPMDARNHLGVAWAAAIIGNFDQAQIHLDLAITLNPNCVKSVVSAAMGYAFFGNAPRGVELLEHALSITPALFHYQWSYAAAVYFLAGDYQAAVDATAKSGEKIVDNQGWRAVALSKLGRDEEARHAFNQLVDTATPMWFGKKPATAERIGKWFVDAYPMRRGKDKNAIRDAVYHLFSDLYTTKPR